MAATSAGNKPRAAALIGQVVLYAALAGVIAVFSRWPSYRQIGPGESLIKLSIVHETQHVTACRKRTPEELAKLPPNMRAPMSCPRERAPLTAEVDLDGEPVVRGTARPSGLARDGRALLYHRLVTTAGSHEIAVRVRDSADTHGFDYEREEKITLQPAQILVIDLAPARREITFR
ncbi:MAG: hypothetical protein AB7G76_15375 [Steroidobacteraceae bacterium]